MPTETVRFDQHQVVHHFSSSVYEIEDNRALLVEILEKPSSPILADYLLSAIGRLHYELGKLMYAERQFRRKSLTC